MAELTENKKTVIKEYSFSCRDKTVFGNDLKTPFPETVILESLQKTEEAYDLPADPWLAPLCTIQRTYKDIYGNVIVITTDDEDDFLYSATYTVYYHVYIFNEDSVSYYDKKIKEYVSVYRFLSSIDRDGNVISD